MQKKKDKKKKNLLEGGHTRQEIKGYINNKTTT